MIARPDQNPYSRIAEGVQSLGYRNELFVERYAFPDYFATNSKKLIETEVAAAAFGQTPVSSETACLGIVVTNGIKGPSLINRCRALGAPVALEIDVAANEIREWGVSSREDQHYLISKRPTSQIPQLLAERAQDWKPETLLRAKSIGTFAWMPEPNLFAGLLPELEEHIQSLLDPLLRSTMSATKAAYIESSGREPNPEQLFKLVFWMLTAKVFRDRQVSKFAKLSSEPDPDEALELVARHYRDPMPRLLNRTARSVAAQNVWSEMDFRNLSADVLAHIWSVTLVEPDTRKRLGIHRTSRSIVRYIIDRVPLAHTGNEKKRIVEPCCGSAVFLVGAMQKIRGSLYGLTAQQRHKYFVDCMAGIELDPFGVEISRLALTLADFPNPNGWDVAQADVFEDGVLEATLSDAGVVLCNPPFEAFGEDERKRYELTSVYKPVELLHRVLSSLPPDGVLGFVLPRTIVDGKSYADVREKIAERFASVHLAVLPDRAFDGADSEVGLLIATDPIPHRATRVSFCKVLDSRDAWYDFEQNHIVSIATDDELLPADARASLAVPELPEAWDYLINYPRLGDVAELHRGIEWSLPLTTSGQENGNREKLVRSAPRRGFTEGVAPQTSFGAFEQPKTRYLDMQLDHQRGGAHKHDWELPKAVVNKSARTRGYWRIAAFPDTTGLVCYQTYIGVWPKSDGYDEYILSAILNGPIANAFIASNEGKTDVRIDTLRSVPVPVFTANQAKFIRRTVRQYQRASAANKPNPAKINELLLAIDAAVLAGYHLPPRIEHDLLCLFRESERPLGLQFAGYPVGDDEVRFTLAEQISPEQDEATVGALLNRMQSNKNGA